MERNGPRVQFLRHRSMLYLAVGEIDGVDIDSAIQWLTYDDYDWADPSKLRLWKWEDWTMMGRWFSTKKALWAYVKDFAGYHDGHVELECNIVCDGEEDSVTEFDTRKGGPLDR